MAQKNTLEIIVKAVTDQAQQEFKKLDAVYQRGRGWCQEKPIEFRCCGAKRWRTI